MASPPPTAWTGSTTRGHVPTQPFAAPAEGARRHVHSNRIEAADRAVLPERCTCCGDTFELHAFRTLPGRIRYFVCREHLISAAARLCVGILMILLAAWAFGTGEATGRAAKAMFALIGVGGVALAWLAIPVRAGLRSRDGWRRLHGICAAAADDIDRVS